MRVEEVGSLYAQITIVLETEEEASILWHILNCGWGKTLPQYFESRGVEIPEFWILLKERMWVVLSRVFHPAGALKEKA